MVWHTSNSWAAHWADVAYRGRVRVSETIDSHTAASDTQQHQTHSLSPPQSTSLFTNVVPTTVVGCSSSNSSSSNVSCQPPGFAGRGVIYNTLIHNNNNYTNYYYVYYVLRAYYELRTATHNKQKQQAGNTHRGSASNSKTSTQPRVHGVYRGGRSSGCGVRCT